MSLIDALQSAVIERTNKKGEEEEEEEEDEHRKINKQPKKFEICR